MIVKSYNNIIYVADEEIEFFLNISGKIIGTASNDSGCCFFADTFHENLKQKTDLLEIMKTGETCHQ